jgi:hypothetical protein
MINANTILDHKYGLMEHFGDWKIHFLNNVGATLETLSEEKLIDKIKRGIYTITN